MFLYTVAPCTYLTKLLCLLYFCLFMLLCFVFATLTYLAIKFALLLSYLDFLQHSSCLVFTKPLCLLYYCLFMLLCFAFAALTNLATIFTPLMSYLDFLQDPSCLVFIFLAGKRIQHLHRGLISLHSFNKPHSMCILNQISCQKDVITARGLCYLESCQIVQRFILKKSIAGKFQNIKSWQYSGLISFYSGILLGKGASIKNFCHVQRILDITEWGMVVLGV